MRPLSAATMLELFADGTISRDAYRRAEELDRADHAALLARPIVARSTAGGAPWTGTLGQLIESHDFDPADEALLVHEMARRGECITGGGDVPVYRVAWDRPPSATPMLDAAEMRDLTAAEVTKALAELSKLDGAGLAPKAIIRGPGLGASVDWGHGQVHASEGDTIEDALVLAGRRIRAVLAECGA